MSDDNEEAIFCACKAQPKVMKNFGNWQVTCVHCGRRGATAGSRWFAVKLWNNDRKGITTTTTTKEHEG